jgi:hypothetical protein
MTPERIEIMFTENVPDDHDIAFVVPEVVSHFAQMENVYLPSNVMPSNLNGLKIIRDGDEPVKSHTLPKSGSGTGRAVVPITDGRFLFSGWA